MALGWDQAIAEASVELGIPFLAALPFPGQECRWPDASQHQYRELLTKAAKVVIVSPGGFSPAAMQRRNEFMVDVAAHHPSGAGLVLALWSGAPGGTSHCLSSAERQALPVINTWQSFRSFANLARDTSSSSAAH